MILGLAVVVVVIAKPRPARCERRDIRVAFSAYSYLDCLTLEGRGGAPDVDLESHLLRIQGQFGHYFRGTGTVLAGAAGYDQLHLGLRSPGAATLWTQLHHVWVRLAVMQRLSRRWNLALFARPGVSSDYAAFEPRDVRITAGAVARFAVRERLEIGFGALYNNGVFGHLVLPVLSVGYRRPTWRLRFDFPERFAGWITPTPWFEAGLRAQFIGDRFGIHGGSLAPLADTVAPLYITLGAVTRFFLVRGFYVALDGGWLVRHLHLLRDDSTSHRRLDFTGWFSSVTIGYLL
ncbi:MAG: DUF6268 family outer membrane beta-barrel protein [Polyangia bacterium]|nr:DUF6268 family outer membrane beta-barrel protein [Polyangia bacterium]